LIPLSKSNKKTKKGVSLATKRLVFWESSANALSFFVMATGYLKTMNVNSIINKKQKRNWKQKWSRSSFRRFRKSDAHLPPYNWLILFAYFYLRNYLPS